MTTIDSTAHLVVTDRSLTLEQIAHDPEITVASVRAGFLDGEPVAVMYAASARSAREAAATATAPSLPCPSWCMLAAGHTWDSVMDHADDSPLATRHHERCIYDDALGDVYLRREDAIDAETGREFIRFASRVMAETRGDPPVMDIEETEQYEQYLAEARAFLSDGYAAGDLRRSWTEEPGWYPAESQ